MQVVEYLKHYGIEKLKRDFAIYARNYRKDKPLFVLNSTPASPKDHAITLECNGLFLDDQYNIISRSFDPINNYFADEHSNIDDSYTFYERVFRDKEFYDKIDAFLVKIYYWDGKWNVGRNYDAFAEYWFPYPYLTYHIKQLSFKKVVFSALGEITEDEFQHFCNRNMDTENTYLFDVTYKVVDHIHDDMKFTLWYLTARKNDTGDYQNSITFDDESMIRRPKIFSFKSLQECAEACKNFEMSFVVYKSNVPFLKIRNSESVINHYEEFKYLTLEKILELYNFKQLEEYLRYFPEKEPYVTWVVQVINEFLEECREKYDKLDYIEERRDLLFLDLDQVAAKAREYNQDFIVTFFLFFSDWQQYIFLEKHLGDMREELKGQRVTGILEEN